MGTGGGTGQFILQALVTLGIGGALAPLIAALFNRGKVKSESGKLSADATAVIAQAAGEVAKNYQQMNENLLTELRQAKEESKKSREESEAARNELRAAMIDNADTSRKIEALQRKLDIAIEILTRLGQDVEIIRY